MGWSSSTSQESLTSHTWSRYTNCMNLSELSVAKKKNGGNQRRTHRNFFSLNKKEWKILLKKKENRVTVTHQQQQIMSDFSSCKGASDSHAISKIELKKKTKKQKQNVFVEMKGLAVFSRLPNAASWYRKKRMNMFESREKQNINGSAHWLVCVYSLLGCYS